MRKYTKGIVDESMSKEEEKSLAIELLDYGFFWLDNTMCEVCSIERNERHYFINYRDRIGGIRKI